MKMNLCAHRYKVHIGMDTLTSDHTRHARIHPVLCLPGCNLPSLVHAGARTHLDTEMALRAQHAQALQFCAMWAAARTVSSSRLPCTSVIGRSRPSSADFFNDKFLSLISPFQTDISAACLSMPAPPSRVTLRREPPRRQQLPKAR